MGQYTPTGAAEAMGDTLMNASRRAVAWIWVVVVALGSAAAEAQDGHGSIVGWGEQVFNGDLSSGFVAIAAGSVHSLG